MSKRQMTPHESEICARLKQARELLGVTQQRCASLLNLERSTLANYESKRTPVKAEVALRFCRNFIINEEWLATGDFKAAEQAGKKQRHPMERLDETLREIFQRHTVDLLSDPISKQIPPNALYSEAFANILAPRYSTLIEKYFYRPRVIPTEADRPELLENLLNAYLFRYNKMLKNEAIRVGKDSWLTQRIFYRSLIETIDLIFKRFMGFPTPEIKESRLNFLRALIESEDAPIGNIHSEAPKDTPENSLLE